MADCDLGLPRLSGGAIRGDELLLHTKIIKKIYVFFMKNGKKFFYMRVTVLRGAKTTSGAEKQVRTPKNRYFPLKTRKKGVKMLKPPPKFPLDRHFLGKNAIFPMYTRVFSQKTRFGGHFWGLRAFFWVSGHVLCVCGDVWPR